MGFPAMGWPGLPEADKSAVATGGVRSPGVLTVPPIRESQNSAAHHVDRPMAVCRRDAQLCFGGAHTTFNGRGQVNEKGGKFLLFRLPLVGFSF